MPILHLQCSGIVESCVCKNWLKLRIFLMWVLNKGLTRGDGLFAKEGEEEERGREKEDG